MTGGKKQVKITVDAAIAQAFKETCRQCGVSMANVLSCFMAGYSQRAAPVEVKDYTTRKKRRKAIQSIVAELALIKGSEEQYRDRIPGNLQGSSVYEKAEELVSLLDETIEQMASF